MVLIFSGLRWQLLEILPAFFRFWLPHVSPLPVAVLPAPIPLRYNSTSRGELFEKDREEREVDRFPEKKSQIPPAKPVACETVDRSKRLEAPGRFSSPAGLDVKYVTPASYKPGSSVFRFTAVKNWIPELITSGPGIRTPREALRELEF